jgi:type VI secretion system protein ImpL
MKKLVWIGILIFLLYLALIVGFAYAAHFEGSRFTIFIVVMGLVGAAALVFSLLYKRKNIDPPVPESAAVEAGNLDALVRSANLRMKTSPGAAKSVAALPLIYVLGDENSAKTQTVLQSGLDPELLAGQVHRDDMVAPTQLANIWYTGSAAIVEAGGALLRQPALWQRLVRLTQPNKVGTALTRGGLQSTRAAVLCVSIERITAANNAEAVRALGQTLNERLRTLSQTLGISLPVYVLFTKLDVISSFGEYATNLTEEEVRLPLGAMLAQIESGAGLYVERATSQATLRFDEIIYSLSEFRVDVLSRGGEAHKLAKAYEFPRELRKLRNTIVDLLVEIGRPSQLGVNSFLRGFYFTGMRAKVVDDSVGAPGMVQSSTPAPAADAGATRIFSFNVGQPVPLPVSVQRGGSRRVPQWVFLPHLFPRVVLADRTALDTSRSSTKTNVVKRVFIGAMAACIFLYFIGLVISYINNSSLENRLRSAAMSTQSVSQGDAAAGGDLQNLERLRLLFAQVAEYRQTGAPFFYTFGLYRGDRLYNTACAAYGSRFRTLLLQPAQSNILGRLETLPAAPRPMDEYIATYQPLRAYLVTTSDRKKSSPEVADALQQAWVADRPLPANAAELSLAQFKIYAATLPAPNSCMADLGGQARLPAVMRARAYLSQFQGIEQVYTSMKGAAARKYPSIRFNVLYPGSARFVVDNYEVDGAFTKGGYAFMQDAILHPEQYTSGEEWVLGPQSSAVDRDALIRQLHAELPARYLGDFLNAWRSYLKEAHVISGNNWAEHREKLHQLDSPSSSLAQLFQVLSANTAVANPPYSAPFQAPQAVVAPTATTLPQGYIAALTTLEGAMMPLTNTPGAPDPMALQAVMQTAGAAEGAVNSIRGAFTPPDLVGKMDKISEDLLLAPIHTAEELARNALKPSGDGAKTLCSQLAPLLSKFPFNPDSHEDASVSEVATALQPGQGVLAQFAATQSKYITLVGREYIEVTPNSVNPAFLRFMSTAQTISSLLYPAGSTSPRLEFVISQQTIPNLAPAVLDIDGTSLSSANVPKSFTWTSSPTSSVRVTSGEAHASFGGPWSLLHFAYSTKHLSSSTLEFPFSGGTQVATSPNGVPLDFKFDVGGPGAGLLNPATMRQLHCVVKVAK